MKPQTSLTLRSHPAKAKDPPKTLEVPAGFCTLCGGPQVLCGGARLCTGGGLSPDHVRWLTAVRSAYACLVLAGSVATAWGGSLLRLARLVIGEAQPPSGLLQVAASHAPLGRGVDNELMANLAAGYIGLGDMVALDVLRGHVTQVWRRQDLAPWLQELYAMAYRAARTTPLAPEAVPLFAVRCAACWVGGAGKKRARERRALVVGVDTFDLAIRCPGCGEVPDHPLPVRLSLPHPVGRCVARPTQGEGAEAAFTCETHHDLAVDPLDAVCPEGRRTLDEAIERAAAMTEGQVPRDEALLDAVIRAQRVAQERRQTAALSRIDRHMEGIVQGIEAGTVDLSNPEHLERAARGAVEHLPDFDLRKVAARFAESLAEGLGLKGLFAREAEPPKAPARRRKKGG